MTFSQPLAAHVTEEQAIPNSRQNMTMLTPRLGRCEKLD
jgi:hypothetical protein